MTVPQDSKAAYLTHASQMLEATENDIINFQEQLEEYTEGITGVRSDMAQNHWQRCVPYMESEIYKGEKKKDQTPNQI